jgi:hypothetical protein
VLRTTGGQSADSETVISGGHEKALELARIGEHSGAEKWSLLDSNQ